MVVTERDKGNPLSMATIWIFYFLYSQEIEPSSRILSLIPPQGGRRAPINRISFQQSFFPWFEVRRCSWPALNQESEETKQIIWIMDWLFTCEFILMTASYSPCAPCHLDLHQKNWVKLCRLLGIICPSCKFLTLSQGHNTALSYQAAPSAGRSLHYLLFLYFWVDTRL